ncbi:MAG: squalene/phytoene synthase family protein [Phycisphaeraceae bacterium]|nr:squalene/phytoene synthase family protein [Phycisphaeraceae bacterium]
MAKTSAAQSSCPFGDDLLWSLRMLPSGQRRPIQCLLAGLAQVESIVLSKDADDDRHGDACTACSHGQNAGGNLNVVAAMVDFLWHGGTTGIPDLDGFAELAGQGRVSAEACQHMAAALAELIELPRVATWSRLLGLLKATGGEAVLMADGLLRQPVCSKPTPLERDQLQAWGAGLAMTRVLSTLGDQQAMKRVWLPLDDLVEAGLGDPNREPEPAAWSMLMTKQIRRVENLLIGGQGALRCWTGPAQRAAAVLAQLHLQRLRTARRVPPWTNLPPLHWRHRVTALPGALRLLRKHFLAADGRR